MSRNRLRPADSVASLLLVAAGLCFAVPRFLHGIGLGDEGALAYGALRVLEGELPSRDFVSLQPPLSYYGAALGYLLGGTSLVALRGLGLLLHLLVALLVYGLARRVADPAPACLAGAAALALGLPQFRFVPQSVWHAIPLVLAGAWLFSSSLATGRRSAALLAGIATGLAALARQDQGFYLALASLAGAALCTRAPRIGVRVGPLLGAWAAGLAGVAGLALLAAGLLGALPALLRQLVVFPLTVYARTSSWPMPTLRAGAPLAENLTHALVYATPLLLLASGLLLVARHRRRGLEPEDLSLGFFTALGVLFYAQVLARSDLHHFLVTLPPVFAVAAGLLAAARDALARRLAATHHGTGRADRIATATLLVGVGILALGYLHLSAPRLFPQLEASPRPLALERGGILLSAQRAERLEALVATIQEHAPAEAPILCLPYSPMLYFLAERPNPTQWNHVWPGDLTAAERRRLLEQARSARPAVVVLERPRQLRRWLPGLVAWVEREYRVLDSRGAVTLYLPRSPPS